MIAYARGLQYWAEKHNLLESPDFCPLAGGIVELRETVSEYVTFTNRDVLWGLGVVHPGATNQWPQTTLFSPELLPPGFEPSGLDTSFTEVTTKTPPPLVAGVDTDRCTTPPFGTEGENWYLLVITTSIEQATILNSPQLTRLEETHSKTHGWLLFSLGQPGQSVMEVPP